MVENEEPLAAGRSLRLAVIIVNYGTPGLTLDCLSSLQSEVEPDRDIVAVVDNASPDDSPARIRQAIERNGWGAWVRLMQADANGGFAAGNNLALAAFTAEAYLLLNSDTEVRPGAIRMLLRVLAANPSAGLVGPRLEGPDGTPQVSCFRTPTPISEMLAAARTGPLTRLFKRHSPPIFEFEQALEPDWMAFACVLIRRQVVEQVGPLDAGYFMYFEDVDYCRRARRAGWRIVYQPEARVMHLASGSSTNLEALLARRRMPRYHYASRARYYATFYGKLGLWLANLLWMAGRAVSLARELAGNKQPHTCQRAGWDNWINWRTPLAP